MITSAYFYQYRNGDFIQFIQNTIDTVKKRDVEALKIKPQLDELEGAFNKLNQLYILDRKNEVTQEIKALDLERDNAIVGINTNISSYQKHFNETKKKAAALLSDIIEKHGERIYNMRYQEETAVLNNLIEEVNNTPEATAARDLLCLTDWFEELERTNKLFDQKYLERNEAYAEAPQESLKDVRTEAEKVYQQFTQILGAHAIITPSDTYQSLINALNSLIKSYNDATASNPKTTKAEDEGMENTTTEE